MLIEIREERPGDVAAIRDLNNRAFGQDQEGHIVDTLRSNGAALLSLVATLDDRVVGHIMYSPLSVGGDVTGAALGPMAVLPEHQGRGVGSRLVEAGNRKLKDAGCPFIIVNRRAAGEWPVGAPPQFPRSSFLQEHAHKYPSDERKNTPRESQYPCEHRGHGGQKALPRKGNMRPQ